MRKIASHIRRFCAEETGPTTVEYAVMLALVVAVAIVAVAAVGLATKDSFDEFNSEFDGAVGGG